MKKCDYCGKEISYFDQYCCDDCQREANNFYEFRDKYTKIFSILNIIGVFGIPVGIFLFSFANGLGATIISLALTLLGIAITLMPFPAENMISKNKIQKAVKQTRIIGIALLALGIICFIADFIFIL